MLPRVGWALALVAITLSALYVVAQDMPFGLYGQLEFDAQSDYSHIRLRRKENIRTLLFVRDTGQEVAETFLDLGQPHRLLTDYTRMMFMSYAFQPKPEKVLIVGLGGGSMVHFLKKHDPDVSVDVVEIDSSIVQIADKYFGVRTEGKVHVITADGIKYLTETTAASYDVIYLDAFLKPSADTDSTGVPLRLKTVQFYKDVQKALKPDGLVVFNLNPHAGTRDDVTTIYSAFPQVYLYRLTDSAGYVAVASTAKKRESPTYIARKAAELDRRFKATFSFARLASQRVQ
jgi:spermidine synthase